MKSAVLFILRKLLPYLWVIAKHCSHLISLPHSFIQVPESKFEVKCVPPGYWDSGFTWAYCDVADPPKCDDFGFESALAAKGISIMERQNVILGGKGRKKGILFVDAKRCHFTEFIKVSKYIYYQLSFFYRVGLLPVRRPVYGHHPWEKSCCKSIFYCCAFHLMNENDLIHDRDLLIPNWTCENVPHATGPPISQ